MLLFLHSFLRFRTPLSIALGRVLGQALSRLAFALDLLTSNVAQITSVVLHMVPVLASKPLYARLKVVLLFLGTVRVLRTFNVASAAAAAAAGMMVLLYRTFVSMPSIVN